MPPTAKTEESPSSIMGPPTAAKRPHAAVSKGNPPLPNLEMQQPWADITFSDFDCSKYDYMPAEDGGYWKLQPHYEASEQLPDIIPLAFTSRSPVQKTQDIEWTCLSAACPSKPFKRKGDLDRHYKNAHGDSQAQASPALSHKDITPATSISNPSPKISNKSQAGGNSNAKGGAAGAGGSRNNSSSGVTGKDKDGTFRCDYPACTRKDDAFSRKDRFRIHLTEVHKEDVGRKGSEITEEFLQARKIYPHWWRCTKCLDRVKVPDSGWECPKDGTKCEEKRREFREKQQQQGM